MKKAKNSKENNGNTDEKQINENNNSTENGTDVDQTNESSKDNIDSDNCNSGSSDSIENNKGKTEASSDFNEKDKSNLLEINELKKNLEEKTRQCEEYFNAVQRTAAEFENYKRRTLKEKEALRLDASIDVVNAFLPVADNLERALKAAEEMENNPLKEGVEMVMRQLIECIGKIGVEPIIAVDQPFNPEIHNAVMHVNEEGKGDNLVVEEFQKGYIMKGKVVRHSMVKVIN